MDDTAILENAKDVEVSISDDVSSSTLDKDMSLAIRIKCGKHFRLDFNPVVTFGSVAIIGLFVALTIVYQDHLGFDAITKTISKELCWFSILCFFFWFTFLIFLCFTKYGSVKLGGPDEQPEYPDVTWVTMMFSCGISLGLFFYGVASPVRDYTEQSRYYNNPFITDNELAQHAINASFKTFGLYAWTPYCIVGLAIGLISHKNGLPVTMKSCLYPLMGDRIFGWVGDLVDTVALFGTVFGVTPAIGLGARQINRALLFFDPSVDPDNVLIQIIIICIVTCLATISAVSGLKLGIRRLSEICFAVGCFIMISITVMVDARYILNLIVQSFGFFFQHFFDEMLYTDAFESSVASHGALDRGRLIPDGVKTTDGPGDWIIGHKMLGMWMWWCAFSSFVGMFLAKISRGRTVREFILGSVVAPGVYCMIWFAIFGGTGIKMEREAAKSGLCCLDPNEIIASDAIQNLATAKSMMDAEISTDDLSWLCTAGECSDCAKSSILNMTVGNLIEKIDTLGNDLGSISLDRSMARMSCNPFEQAWFDVMRSFGGMISDVLVGLSFLSISLYFVTTVDSGALVVDSLAANGNEDAPIIQRIFWSVMMGSLSVCLLVVGGSKALLVLQDAYLLFGLPSLFTLNIYVLAIWRAFKGQQSEGFNINVLDPLYAQAFKKMEIQKSTKLFFMAIFAMVGAPLMASVAITNVLDKDKISKKRKMMIVSRGILLATPFYAAWILLGLTLILGMSNMMGFIISFYVIFGYLLAYYRSLIRATLKIQGSMLIDLLLSIFIYPCVVVQLVCQ